MNVRQNTLELPLKTWATPQLVSYGGIEKVTGWLGRDSLDEILGAQFGSLTPWAKIKPPTGS
jgi:hypothetical protein